MSFFCLSQKMYFRFVCPPGSQFFGFRRVCSVNEVVSTESHRALGPFSMSYVFMFFASCCSEKKTRRPSGLVPAMSTFATPFWHAGTRVLRFFLAKRVEENHRCNVLLAKKCDGAELAPSRWMALLRRHFDASARAANPTVRQALFHFLIKECLR